MLAGLTYDEILKLISDAGFNPAHALRICNGIYRNKCSDVDEIRDIPKSLREFLNEKGGIGIPVPAAREISSDGSEKFVFSNHRGQLFESVYIPELKRKTLCISTQSGCRYGCAVCATGRYGFFGNLGVSDIIGQILGVPYSSQITHIVFMGMGEPMDNLSNVLKALGIIMAGRGLAIGKNNITVSTVGLLPQIRHFLDMSDCNLAISMYSPFSEERIALVPAEANNPIKEILEVISSYPVLKKRRISAAYVMLKGINDTDRHLRELISLIRNSGLRVNLIPFHQFPDCGYASSGPDRLSYFRNQLLAAGISASVRKSRGADISAACGLLASGF